MQKRSFFNLTQSKLCFYVVKKSYFSLLYGTLGKDKKVREYAHCFLVNKRQLLDASV